MEGEAWLLMPEGGGSLLARVGGKRHGPPAPQPASSSPTSSACSWGFWVNSNRFPNGTPHVLTLTSRGGRRLNTTITSMWRAQVWGSRVRVGKGGTRRLGVCMAVVMTMRPAPTLCDWLDALRVPAGAAHPIPGRRGVMRPSTRHW